MGPWRIAVKWREPGLGEMAILGYVGIPFQPQEDSMTRHLIDHRSPSQGSRVRHFMRLSRAESPAWHRSESFTGNSRLVHYCRIARGWTV